MEASVAEMRVNVFLTVVYGWILHHPTCVVVPFALSYFLLLNNLDDFSFSIKKLDDFLPIIVVI